MSLPSDDIILLSSDDELDSRPPPKKVKVENDPGKQILQKLTQLTEITTAIGLERPTVLRKTQYQENHITIVIPDEKNSSKHNETTVVNLIDESPDISFEAENEKKDTVSGDCLILGSDSESEGSDQLFTLPKSRASASSENLENRKESENSDKPKDARRSEAPDENRTEEKGPEEAKERPEVNGHASPDVPPKEPETEEESKGAPVENEDVLNRPSTSTASEAHKLLDEFLDICAKSMRGSKYESKVLPIFPKMKSNFAKCESMHQEPYFQRMLQEHVSSAKISAPQAVISFQRLYSYLLDHVNGGAIDVDEKDLAKLKQLEKTCKRLVKRLHLLENADLNFDDEEDSTYMQIDRYSRRLNQVYSKYCQLLKKNPHAGRLLYEKVQFVSSRYNEINRAITKSYKHNRFPTYYDVEKCIRKCVSTHGLGLSESEIKEESKKCFTKMGNLLQLRRKKELYEIHCGFITLNEDPAKSDEGLKVKLQESLEEGEKKMKEVVEKYSRMQDGAVEMELSEDSDDSNYKESESEAEEPSV